MKKIILLLFIFLMLMSTSAYLGYRYVVSTLPPMMSMEDYKPLLVSQVYDRNHQKIGEFFRERRILVLYKQIPEIVVKAFIAAEDDSFFQHRGVNYLAIIRATLANLKAGRKVQGGSTITQQVARTFFLSNEKTMFRKLREVFLAIKMEENFSKEDILYLYLNQIFFGQGAYGIAAASEVYFRKPVQQLTLPEAAILAGLPKAPTDYNPIRNPVRAKERQNYVLHRMAEVGFITKKQAQEATQQPVKIYTRENYQTYAPFFLDAVRALLINQLGEETVLDKGLMIETSLDLKKQMAAQESVERGLKDLDKRQGYRGPLRNFTNPKEVGAFLLRTRNQLIQEAYPERTLLPSGHFVDYGPLNLKMNLQDSKSSGVQRLPFYLKIGKTMEGIVSRVDDRLGLVYVKAAEIEGLIDFETMRWARKPNPEKTPDADRILRPSQVLKMGDVILVRLIANQFGVPLSPHSNLTASHSNPNDFISNWVNHLPPGSTLSPPSKFKGVNLSRYVTLELDQDPQAQGALLSLDQQNEDILAMVGGYNYETSKYNRALQAARQTGSAFKAIVYLSALEKGYTPSTPIMDAPVVYEEPVEEGQDATASTLSGKNGKKGKGKIEDSDENAGPKTKIWKPTNHSKKFGGDIIFRNALARSLNVPTVKIIEDIGVPWAAEFAQRLGIFSPLNMDFTLALGSSSLTLYELTKVFSQFGRMGQKIQPILVHSVKDSSGNPILSQISLDLRFEKEIKPIKEKFEARRLSFLEKNKNLPNGSPSGPGGPGGSPGGPSGTPGTPGGSPGGKPSLESSFFFENPLQLIHPQAAYVITSLLKAVVEDPGGTGGKARALGREVAGKTGTTNGYYDALFFGYTYQINTGVWVGFDQEKSLGRGEVGGRAALPIWLEYMKFAHQGIPEVSFPVPPGIVFANIDGDTGQLASANTRRVIRQAYIDGTEPSPTRHQPQDDTDFLRSDLSE